jgi:general secretion pathway protein A
MYEGFFGLRERPFDLTPNPRYLVLTTAHREALSNLEYGIASRKGITLLIGEAGCGKTTIIRAALERQPERVHCVYLHNPALTRDEFIEMLAARFELSERARSSKTVLLLELEAMLRQRYEDGQTTVLVVDEAQSLSLELLEEIRLLANIETTEGKLLSVVMAGQPELAARLNDLALRQLKQRVALRCELRPLTQIETASYIVGRIVAAGGTGAQVFTREAVTLIHERSKGIPRTISVIADNALLTAFATSQRPATSQIVLDVCRDFDIAADAVAPSDAPRLIPATERQASSDLAILDRADVPSEPLRAVPLDGSQQQNKAGERQPDPPTRTASIFASLYPKRRRFSLFFQG